jgi:alkylation response protein AidB-like acyl-CoA dehydrogenase
MTAPASTPATGSSAEPFDPARHLPDDLLARIHDRAAVVDRENRFITDDLADLRRAGYLDLLVPERFGGAGLGLAEATTLQTRLARSAAATALAVNMHLVWTSVARIVARSGDDRMDFVPRESAAGELFAFGISEPGNDLMLFDSETDAVPEPDGGVRFTGTKIFTTLSPAFTRLGVLGLDTTSPDAPCTGGSALSSKELFAALW